ncbi:putative formate dehydrogenase, alpha subunit [Streptomyces sp. Tu6071]|nr:putative formate dehydrogenase, alpha subunit [Streptomyces sp. Tu6071]
MGLGEVGALDDDAVAVPQILEERRGAAAPEGGAEPGDGGAVADAGLVLDLYDAERGEELLDEVVLLVVERRAAEARDAHRARGAHPVALPLPGLGAGADDALGDHVHRRLQVERLPVGAVRPAVQDLVAARGARRELERGGALGAQAAPADGRGGVALDLRDLLALDVDLLAAADGAVRAHRADDAVGGGGTGPQPGGRGRACRVSPAERVGPGELPVDRPVGDPGAQAHRVLP